MGGNEPSDAVRVVNAVLTQVITPHAATTYDYLFPEVKTSGWAYRVSCLACSYVSGAYATRACASPRGTVLSGCRPATFQALLVDDKVSPG